MSDVYLTGGLEYKKHCSSNLVSVSHVTPERASYYSEKLRQSWSYVTASSLNSSGPCDCFRDSPSEMISEEVTAFLHRCRLCQDQSLLADTSAPRQPHPTTSRRRPHLCCEDISDITILWSFPGSRLFFLSTNFRMYQDRSWAIKASSWIAEIHITKLHVFILRNIDCFRL